MRRPTTGDVRTRLVHGLALVLLCALAVLALLFVEPERIYAHAAQIAELATYPVMLAAAALLYVYFRLTPEDGTAWLATAAVFGTTQGIGYAALRVVMEDEVRRLPGLLMLTQIAVAVLLVALLAAQRVLRDLVDPLLVGLGLGLVVTFGRLALVDRVPPSSPLHASVPGLVALLLALYAAMGVLLVRSVRLPGWASERLATVVVLLGAAQVLTYPVAHDDVRSLAAVGLFVCGAALLGVTSLELVRAAVARQAESESLVDALEAHLRQDRTVMHEVAGTVAAISAASRLLTISAGMSAAERRRLQELLDSEAARVERLISATRDQRIVDVDLDPLVSSVLLAQGIRGRVVAWHPTGRRVRARADDVVEVLTLLLDNAAVHSGSTMFEVLVRQRGHEVELVVADAGRGIAPDVEPTLTDWGARGAQSAGQGIGLSEANRLVTAMGGRLTIASEAGIGTRVSVVLPGAPVVEEVTRGRPSA